VAADGTKGGKAEGGLGIRTLIAALLVVSRGGELRPKKTAPSGGPAEKMAALLQHREGRDQVSTRNKKKRYLISKMEKALVDRADP